MLTLIINFSIDKSLELQAKSKLNLITNTFQFPILYIGLTTTNPTDWDLTRRNIQMRDRPDVWGFGTDDGDYGIVGGHYLDPSEEWLEVFGERNCLSDGDMLSLDLCMDGSVSFSHNDKCVTDMFPGGLPQPPLWVAIMTGAKRIEVIPQGEITRCLSCMIDADDFNC